MTAISNDLLEVEFEPARSLEPAEREVAAVIGRVESRRTRIRRHRRGVVLGALGAILLTAGAGAATGVLPIGTELPTDSVTGKGEPHYTSKRVVVATGETHVAGRWQATVTESDRGLCFGLELIDAEPGGLSEGCGGASESFDAASVGGGSSLPNTTLVYGPAPNDAAAVRATAPGGFRQEVKTHQGPESYNRRFYVMEIPRKIRDVEVTWVNSDGRVPGPGVFVPSTITYDGTAADPELPH